MVEEVVCLRELTKESPLANKIAEVEIRPYLNRYNEVKYKVVLKVYLDSNERVPKEIRGDSEILGSVFCDTWGWCEEIEKDGRKIKVRTRYEVFDTKEDAEEEAREIIETLRENFRKLRERLKQIEREKKTIHIYL